MAGGAPEFGLPGGFPRTGPTRTSIAVRRLEAAQDVKLYRDEVAAPTRGFDARNAAFEGCRALCVGGVKWWLQGSGRVLRLGLPSLGFRVVGC